MQSVKKSFDEKVKLPDDQGDSVILTDKTAIATPLRGDGSWARDCLAPGKALSIDGRTMMVVTSCMQSIIAAMIPFVKSRASRIRREVSRRWGERCEFRGPRERGN